MTLKERREAVKDYVRKNRDFAFFCAGATAMVLGQMAVIRHIPARSLNVEGDVIVNDELTS